VVVTNIEAATTTEITFLHMAPPFHTDEPLAVSVGSAQGIPLQRLANPLFVSACAGGGLGFRCSEAVLDTLLQRDEHLNHALSFAERLQCLSDNCAQHLAPVCSFSWRDPV
jgi:hypothetical protein